ncbi:hypothetical protein MUK42_08521 [Musa troglodytarum]|uniref:Uncharacterized protein n=1 Tax=Musa troglodytarum TaxID=320322 RepID=A0A9E7K785_9LILI|nr:hypothetical protein MUK42_08521 [Musa troglodytarum]
MESEGGDDDEREVAKQEKNAKSNRAAAAECRVLVRQPGGSRSISLNLDELRACHELRLELPFEDLAVGLPPGFSDMQVNTVAGDSPLVDWKINSPEEDPVKMKERIKVWVQAVALSYACHHRSK